MVNNKLLSGLPVRANIDFIKVILRLQYLINQNLLNGDFVYFRQGRKMQITFLTISHLKQFFCFCHKYKILLLVYDFKKKCLRGSDLQIILVQFCQIN